MNVEDYNTWTKEQLVEKIRKLECHVRQLRNVISKTKPSPESGSDPFVVDPEVKRIRLDCSEDAEVEDADAEVGLGSVQGRRKKARAPRPFDFTKVEMRHTALKILYLGWDYQGLAVQEDTNETIEAHLFSALMKTRLIEVRSKSNYHRCGRTDKGVSAFSQVISIDLRSKVVDGKEALDYCRMLNKTLPKEIRVIAWSPVRPSFSARFNCCRRTYRYFFPRGNLNIEKMLDAAQFLVGEHDFRNFCKLDKANKTTIRAIQNINIEPKITGSPLHICQLIIDGSSFVWHQIRCIVGVLLLIGQGQEEPEIVRELLDLQKYPKKPQYKMAVDYPLVLFGVDYPETEGIVWNYTPENMTCLLNDLQERWMINAVKAEMTKEMVQNIDSLTEIKPEHITSSLIMGTRCKSYVNISKLPVCAN